MTTLRVIAQAKPSHTQPYPGMPCQMMPSHRNDLLTKGHYADQQPLPYLAEPSLAPPSQSWPFRASAPDSALTEGARRCYAIATCCSTRRAATRSSTRFSLPLRRILRNWSSLTAPCTAKIATKIAAG